MRKVFLISLSLILLTGCAAKKSETVWINPKVPLNNQAEHYYQALNLCQNVANGANVPIEQTSNEIRINPYPSNTIPGAADNLQRATANVAQTRRWVQMRDDCMRGHGWILTTQEEANVQWHLKAAEQGNRDAQVRLGAMYAKGLGVPQDDTRAAQWYQKAAEQGNTEAQLLLGLMYVSGRGVVHDQQKGCSLMRMAGEQGNPKAKEFFNRYCAP